MDTRAVRRVLAGLLDTMPNKPPIVWENTRYEPIIGGMFIRENVLFGNTVPLGVGFNSATDSVGIYQLTITSSTEETAFPWLDMENAIRSHFARGIYADTITKQKLEIIAISASPLQIIPPWVSLPVSIRFRVVA